MIKRFLELNQLVKDNSLLLLGPRGTGKSFLLKEIESSIAHYLKYNFLEIDTLRKYQTNPFLFGLEVKSAVSKLIKPSEHLIVIIDEVQLFAEILNEVHKLIEEYQNRIRFILTGSSARKLKRVGVNLLAGRAIIYNLYPVSPIEIEIPLIKALRYGTLPKTFYLDNPKDYLKTYVETYIKEEIIQEAVTRKIQSFYGFLELAGQYSGKIINHSKLARELGVAVTTVQDYFTILTDTLITRRLNGWSRSVKKQLVQAPKYYFFDCGVANTINRMLDVEMIPGTTYFGDQFEAFIINQIFCYKDYYKRDFEVQHFRTAQDNEIDVILNRGAFKDPIAIEIKSSSKPHIQDFGVLKKFKEEYVNSQCFCFCTAEKAYSVGGIDFFPWQEGLKLIKEW